MSQIRVSLFFIFMFNFCGLMLANLCLLYGKYGILKITILGKWGGGCSPLSPLVSPGLLFNFSGSVLANLCLLYGNMVFLKITILGKSRGAVAPSASRSSRAGICVIGEYYVAKSVCASYLPSFRS